MGGGEEDSLGALGGASVFVKAGSKFTARILDEAKSRSDKTWRLLRDLGVPVE